MESSEAEVQPNYEKQYNEEHLLFEIVGPRFQQQGWLGAYDLFSIVRRKANPAMSKAARAIV